MSNNSAVMRATTRSETRGFLKALVAGEILPSVQIAMLAGLPHTALRDAILTHPTLVEGLIPLFSSAASVHNAPVAARTGA